MSRLRVLLRLAVRNVRRHARRSLLTAAAMILGLALLVFSRALATGAHEDWIRAGVRLGTGHIALQSPTFRSSGRIEDRLAPEAARAAETAIEAPAVADAVDVAVAMLTVQGLASSAENALPVEISGVDPAAAKRFSLIAEKIVAGRYLEPADRVSAVVGTRAAERLHLDVGSRLVLTAQDAHGQIVGQFTRVVGIFKTGVPEADEGIVHLPLATTRQWLDTGDAVTSVAILLRSDRDLARVSRALRDALADRADVAVLRWQEAMPQLEAAVKVDDWGDYVFHGVLFAIVALAIVNTMLMSVMYRSREFGVLRALGLTARQTAALVFCEGLTLTMLSGAIGLVLGIAVTWTFFRHGLDYSSLLKNDFSMAGSIINPVIIPQVRLVQVIQSLAFTLVIGVVASLYPAYRATRIDLAEAMKFEA